ncbi:hypothetical protein B0H16DRAFT_1825715 [Mycena metata]|uniref:Uncharacterized protein n=1 Tax=Mycena metata TaxID=1033252 RepID=A0AAD7GWI8_9AGAR|nr:hypothetical protein B0H16DRAFT_1825715 [Mycena metata]
MGVSMPPIADITLLLTLLKWVGYDVEAISMLNPLTLPLLTSLDIDSGLNDPADEEGFFSLCKRSSFTLQYLRLAGIPLSLPRLSTYLLAMPSLTVLKLSSCIDNDSTDGFLTFLTYDERQPVLPQLKELSIYRPQARFSAWVMLQMVESRWPSTPLTEVWIGSTAKDSQLKKFGKFASYKLHQAWKRYNWNTSKKPRSQRQNCFNDSDSFIQTQESNPTLCGLHVGKLEYSSRRDTGSVPYTTSNLSVLFKPSTNRCQILELSLRSTKKLTGLRPVFVPLAVIPVHRSVSGMYHTIKTTVAVGLITDASTSRHPVVSWLNFRSGVCSSDPSCLGSGLEFSCIHHPLDNPCALQDLPQAGRSAITMFGHRTV